jgi:hypothetical protein
LPGFFFNDKKITAARIAQITPMAKIKMRSISIINLF